jgi:hypothetical protein
MNDNFINTVRLLLKVAPAVFYSKKFALKGGTAINLFIREMPRLSVDLDLIYTRAFQTEVSNRSRCASAGKIRNHSAATIMLPIPPITTDAISQNAAAREPDSNSPN